MIDLDCNWLRLVPNRLISKIIWFTSLIQLDIYYKFMKIIKNWGKKRIYRQPVGSPNIIRVQPQGTARMLTRYDIITYLI